MCAVLVYVRKVLIVYSDFILVRLLQDLDEKRIKNIKNFMLSSVDVERKVFPIIMQCLDGMEHAANSINEKEVILKYYFQFFRIILKVFLNIFLFIIFFTY